MRSTRQLGALAVALTLVGLAATTTLAQERGNGDSRRQRPLSGRIGLRVDPTGSVVVVDRQRPRTAVDPRLDMVAAVCTNCGGGCPSFSRTVQVTLEADAAVAAGYGVSDLTSTNFAVTNVVQSTSGALAAGQQLTISITGDVGNCSSSFNVWFSLCDVAPAAPSDHCPACLVNSDCPSGQTCVIGATAAANACYPEVVAYWRFEDGSGSTLGDVSGNGVIGAIASGAWVPGKIGGALEFSGAANPVVFPSGAISDLPAGTMSLWINRGDTGDGQYFFGRRDGIFDRVDFSFGFEYGRAYSATGTANTSYAPPYGVRDETTAASVMAGAWTMLTYVWDSDELWIYLNGRIDGHRRDVTNRFALNQVSGSFVMGSLSNGAGGFHGKLDEMLVSSAKLSPAQVLALYTAQDGSSASCSGVTCPSYCDGSTLFTAGACSAGECSYTAQPCSGTCVNDTCFTATPSCAWAWTPGAGHTTAPTYAYDIADRGGLGSNQACLDYCAGLGVGARGATMYALWYGGGDCRCHMTTSTTYLGWGDIITGTCN